MFLNIFYQLHYLPRPTCRNNMSPDKDSLLRIIIRDSDARFRFRNRNRFRNQSHFCWNRNRNQQNQILAGIGIGTGIRLLDFPGIGIGIRMYQESCITDQRPPGQDIFLVLPLFRQAVCPATSNALLLHVRQTSIFKIFKSNILSFLLEIWKRRWP